MQDSITTIDEQDEIAGAIDGPSSPDEDETYGPEADDPRAAGAYHDPYDVPHYDPAHELHDCACQGGHH